MKIEKTAAAVLLMSTLVFTLSACQDKGPMEEAGEEIDEVIEDAGEAIDDATDGN